MKINDVHCCAITRSSFLIMKNSATPLAHSLALKIDLIWGYGGSVPHFIKFDSIFHKRKKQVPTKVLVFFFSVQFSVSFSTRHLAFSVKM